MSLLGYIVGQTAGDQAPAERYFADAGGKRADRRRPALSPCTGEGKSSRRLSERGARTYTPHLWGVQHKDRQREDGLDLDKAAKRDHDALEKAVAERDSDKAG